MAFFDRLKTTERTPEQERLEEGLEKTRTRFFEPLAVTVMAALFEADPPVLQFCIWLTVALMLYAFVLYLFMSLRLGRTGRPPVDKATPGK